MALKKRNLFRVLDFFTGHPFVSLLGGAALGLLWTLEAWARAGGGQHYTGGGGGGGGGGFGGGGGGDGDGIVFLLYLVLRYPKIGVPVLIVVVVASVIKHMRNPDRTTSRAVKRLEHIPFMARPDLGSLRARDPGFDESRFLERVKAAEAKVQEAWRRGEMKPVRSLLSDGLMRRLDTQLSLMRRFGTRNITADHHVFSARIHAADYDDHFDTLHVAIEAAIRDLDVPASLSFDEALARAEKAPQQRYTEIWSFLRRPGARSSDALEALSGKCPSCGASLESGAVTRCDHCQALVNSGQYDWVLAEITQVEEWRPRSTGRVQGLDRLAAKDPGFNRQAAEDRASYLFWRWIEALATGSAKPLAKVALSLLKQEISQLTKNGPRPLHKVAVGGVDLLACETDTGDGRDRYHVKVLWSSASSEKGRPAHQANVLTMSRKSDVEVKATGFAHARCPECHGPLEENDSPSCDYCGAALDAGDADWVLHAVIQPEAFTLAAMGNGREAAGEIPVVIPDMGSLRERTLLLMRMAAVVMADGVVTKAERKLLKNAAKRWQVSFDAIAPILAGETDAGMVTTMRPSNPVAFLKGLISAALVDGRVDKKEERLLLDIAQNLGIEERRAREMMVKMTKDMH
jgi:hypothetical protein